MIPETLQKKATSGRLFLVVCVGLVFVYTACAGMLEDKDVMIVVLLVAKDYFSRNRSSGNAA